MGQRWLTLSEMMGGLGVASIGSFVGAHDLIAKPPTLWRIMRYSHEHTSIRFAAQAANRATVSATCTRSPEDLKVVLMTFKTSGDSTQGVSHDIFRGIQDSFTTQGLRQLRAEMALVFRQPGPQRRVNRRRLAGLQPHCAGRVRLV
jgi:hypothetical protein